MLVEYILIPDDACAMFLVVDGIDGSGKSSIIRALAERRRKDGGCVFDLRAFAREEHRFPEPEELRGYDLLVTGEPTYAWVGAALREEIIRANNRDYGSWRSAEAFALDRLLHYRRVLLPARERGMDIIAERSVTSTLVYQLVQSERTGVPALTIEALCALEGNAIAITNPPDLFLLLSVDPARAFRRLDVRIEEQAEVIFEHFSMLEALAAGFCAPAFRQLLQRYGWHIAEVDANGAVEDAVASATMRIDALAHSMSV